MMAIGILRVFESKGHDWLLILGFAFQMILVLVTGHVLAHAPIVQRGLRAMARHLKPGGVFGLWSNDRPDDAFTQRL